MRSLLAIVALLFSTSLLAAPQLIPAAPDVGAKAYLLEDFHSGDVLAEHNADKRIEPASLTKLMTSYVVAYELANGTIHLDDKVRISKKAWRMGGSRMFVEVGTKVPVRELVKGMVVQSGNDATVALAEYVAGSEDAFVDLMNEHARELGMKHTHFANATGLPNPKHYTTARDLAKLTRALIRDFPQDYDWYDEKQFTYNHIKQYNRNRLLWLDDRVDGVKTGHTDSAGYCLIASAKQDAMRLISVVAGTKSNHARVQASRALLNYGFRFYNTYKLYAAGKPLTTMTIYKGAQEKLPLGLDRDLYVTIPRGQRDHIKANMDVDATIVAPAHKGQSFGAVNVTLDGKPVAKRPLVALQDVDQGGLWRRMVDNVVLMFK